ncbi:MAG: AmmeMemoRadiSam system protein B [Nitrospiraceae bacterium]|nr:MAG: AmmeMemoRadiSam system protein B [Nitrospiraceae bacterium]
MKRSPAVAGQFYQGTASKLTQQVRQYININAVKEHAIGILSPHAGLIYSGSVAGEVYSAIEFPKTFVLLGPNHTGLGPKISMMASGEWEIPTGVFSVDEKLSRKIASNTPIISTDANAHTFEHSLEVQLPFIAYFSTEPKIVPITVMSVSLEECRMLGEGIAKSIQSVIASSVERYSVVIVASSDMSHYVADDVARQKDKKAIEMIKSLNPEGLYTVVSRERISMCGYLPATIMLFAAKALGAIEARLIKYSTSGEVSGDYDQVVGYAGMIVK